MDVLCAIQHWKTKWCTWVHVGAHGPLHTHRRKKHPHKKHPHKETPLSNPQPPGLIGLFAPPEELSAGAVIGCFEFYALAHQADFDVCWCKGSVAERIFEPLMSNIRASGGEILGNRAVQDVKLSPSGAVTGVVCKDFSTGQQYEYDADAVVFAVGITGACVVGRGKWDGVLGLCCFYHHTTQFTQHRCQLSPPRRYAENCVQFFNLGCSP